MFSEKKGREGLSFNRMNQMFFQPRKMFQHYSFSALHRLSLPHLDYVSELSYTTF